MPDSTKFKNPSMFKELPAEYQKLSPIPVCRVLRMWKTTLANEMVACDSTGMEVTGIAATMPMLILRKLLHLVLAKDEQNVGILLPPSVPCMLLNVALTADKRVPINLNYTSSNEILNKCVNMAQIKHLITSRKVMERLKFKLDCEVVYLEDLAKKISLGMKLSCAFQGKFLSYKTLIRKMGLDKIDPDSIMAILFTSGSTGTPKGVMLTHRNLSANIDGCTEFFHLSSEDRILGVLPTFHSFGYMASIWAAMSIGMRALYHYSPLDSRVVSMLCRKYGTTIFICTPTFLRLYARRLDEQDFKTVNLIMSGAERCPVSLMDEYERRFGIRPVQGYGITETSPVISAGLPKTRHWGPDDRMPKDESLGLPLPGIEVKVLDLQTEELCQEGQVGMLWVRGPNVMKGYYQQPEKTAEVLKDGWYCTGDLVSLDADGNIFMAGRLSRFAKIGGEMVPFEGIEDVLNRVLKNNIDEPPKLCVTSVPDERKGEKIVVLYTEMSLSLAEVREQLIAEKIPPIWIPDQDAYHQVEAIPLLGTGKLDLYSVRQKANEIFGVK